MFRNGVVCGVSLGGVSSSRLIDLGTGYYYSRFRPGLGVRLPLPHSRYTHTNAQPFTLVIQTVLIFLTLLTALLQNVVQRITYKSEVERVRKFMLLARQAAWGSKLTGRTEAPRKVKVNLRGNPDVEGEEQEFVPGRTVEMLVHGDEVYLVSNQSNGDDLPSLPCPA